MRDTVNFPTKFGPATTRMPPLPDGRGKRKSTWKMNEPEGRVEPEKKKGQPTRGEKGVKRQRSLGIDARRKAARKMTNTNRRINRGGRA